MKKLFFALAFLSLVATGCKPKEQNLVDTEPYTLCDSVYLENDYEQGFSHYTTNIDLPVTNNETLRKNILHWMLSPETEDYETFLKEEMNQFFSEEGSEPRSELENNYTLSEQTDRYVTYITEGYIYTGGAHPTPWYYGTTFSKIDGSIVGYDMFENTEQLAKIVTEHIKKQYIEDFDMVEEMFELGEEDHFMLPENEPWIETDSIVFCYQTYEIAPYSAGMPLCKISKEDLWPYLSEKGKSLFTNTHP
jgi:hypothetical protein